MPQYPIDMQSHSFFSDGDVSPTVLAQRAAAAGLRGIFLTDHATTAGWPEFSAACARLNLLTAPAVEITCRHGPLWFDTLAYGVDPSHADLHALVARNHQAFQLAVAHYFRWLDEGGRGPAIETICAHYRLPHRQPLGYWINKYRSQVDGRSAEELTQDMQAAGFSYEGRADIYLAHLPPFSEVIRAVAAAGGLLALAHPGQTARRLYRALPGADHLRQFLALAEELCREGLEAIEMRHNSHTRELSAAVTAWAVGRAPPLLLTAGSDYHGDGVNEHKPHVHLGDHGLTIAEFAPLAVRLRLRLP